MPFLVVRENDNVVDVHDVSSEPDPQAIIRTALLDVKFAGAEHEVFDANSFQFNSQTVEGFVIKVSLEDSVPEGTPDELLATLGE